MQCDILSDWDSILDCFSAENKDIYFSKRYVELYETGNIISLCAICSDEDKIMLMPFLRDEVEGCYDFETAYGYGGPIANTNDLKWCNRAYACIYDHLRDNGYVCGFTRFHPLLNNERLAYCNEIGLDADIQDERNIKILFDRNTVAIDTSQEIDQIWSSQISSKNRNMIRKAEKNGLEYCAEFEYDSIDSFIALYESTMLRLSADDFYFFDRGYFDLLKKNLSGNSFLGTVKKDGKLICAAVFMYSDLFGHYHLEGSDRNYSNLGANNYLLWKTACKMHEMGIRELHIGGGTSSSSDDSLYKFKRVFSNNIKDFYIGKEIFNPSLYNSICCSWEKNNSDKVETYGNRLLKYKY